MPRRSLLLHPRTAGCDNVGDAEVPQTPPIRCAGAKGRSTNSPRLCKAWRPPNETLCQAVCALRVPARFAPWVPAELMSPERARESQSALGWKGTRKDVESDPTSLPQPHSSAMTPGLTVRMHEVGRDRCFPAMCPCGRWGHRQHHGCHLVPPASSVGTPWAGKLEEAAPRWEEIWGQCVTCRPCTSLGGETLSGCWH